MAERYLPRKIDKKVLGGFAGFALLTSTACTALESPQQIKDYSPNPSALRDKNNLQGSSFVMSVSNSELTSAALGSLAVVVLGLGVVGYIVYKRDKDR